MAIAAESSTVAGAGPPRKAQSKGGRSAGQHLGDRRGPCPCKTSFAKHLLRQNPQPPRTNPVWSTQRSSA